MSMQLMSELLLKREIERYEESPELMQENKLFYYLCKKELAVIKKLEINQIDMRGEIEEFNQSLSNQSIYFMDSQEFEEMKEKARKYDIISKVVRDGV